MLQIAICDDQPQELSMIAAYTKEYCETNHIEAIVRQFIHPDELLAAREVMPFQIYILDVVMPMVNGIEAGKEIRKLDRKAQIIYITSEPSFALEAYSVNPVNYLIKPVGKQFLYDTLTFAIAQADLEDEPTVSIKTKDGLCVLPLSFIACCEYANHTVVYTLTDGKTIQSVSSRTPFSVVVEPMLQDRRFLQPHSAFVVNMNRVTDFSKERFTLRGGATVPISAKQYSMVRDAYMDYLLLK